MDAHGVSSARLPHFLFLDISDQEMNQQAAIRRQMSYSGVV
jgi:hypothetical protein